MTRLFILRHGPTAWNRQGRIQGRADEPLLGSSAALVQSWRLPKEAIGAEWHCSPLRRALQTAALLGADAPEIAGALIEMDWGAWEGLRLADLRQELGEEMEANEARGLDFRPPEGESPRDVQARLRPWLAGIAGRDLPQVAVCHKGVIRALYALASGWNMTGKAPEKLRDACCHLFEIGADGAPTVARLNIPLDASSEDAP